jgi:Protein of unknown function (DUF3071)
MQELRLVAVSEDGSYLVLATAGRGTRFTLPVDDRLRAVVRGHFSRLGQYEIEVESPLRPKEIQARIRAGETADEIAETAGIPVERIRWFEGPVLQEREYMAQQAQRVTVRRQGDSTPGPPLGEIVEERLGKRGVDLEEAEWDSRKCEDSTWRVRLSFSAGGRPYAAEWAYDPRRRHVSAVNEEASRLSSLDVEEPADDTVTPFLPRRAMKVVAEEKPPEPPAEQAPEPPKPEPRTDVVVEPRGTKPPQRQAPAERPAPRRKAEPAPRPAAAAAAERKQPERNPAPRPAETVAERPAAAAAGGKPATPPQEKRPAPRKKSRGKRASVPSWDEIMFGARRPE